MNKSFDEILAEVQRIKNLQPYEPCSPGCLSHITHPCERCGRIGGRPQPRAGDDAEGYAPPISRLLCIPQELLDLSKSVPAVQMGLSLYIDGEMPYDLALAAIIQALCDTNQRLESYATAILAQAGWNHPVRSIRTRQDYLDQIEWKDLDSIVPTDIIHTNSGTEEES